MKISEILRQESYDAVRIYKQGIFWTAYEQSAYYIWKQKGYKLKCRFVKSVNRFVVSLGFPESSLLVWQQEHGWYPKQQKENYRQYGVKFPLDHADFNLWKQGMENTKKIHDSKDEMFEKIKNYPLTLKTPLDAFLFFKDLQDMLKKINFKEDGTI